jgi:chemotaxis response regulator CheB
VIQADAGLRLVGQASNVEKALELVDELRPDVAILDVHMPNWPANRAKAHREKVPGKARVAHNA